MAGLRDDSPISKRKRRSCAMAGCCCAIPHRAFLMAIAFVVGALLVAICVVSTQTTVTNNNPQPSPSPSSMPSVTPMPTNPPGVNWATVTTGVSASWGAVTYAGSAFGRYVAVAVNCGVFPCAMTSSDGTTWSAATGSALGWWNDVALGTPSMGSPILVAVGSDNIGSTPSGQRIMTSLDGNLWTYRTATSLINNINWQVERRSYDDRQRLYCHLFSLFAASSLSFVAGEA
jgi:hypothetical protein